MDNKTEVLSYYDRYFRDLKQKAENEINKAIKKSYSELFEKVEKDVYEIFRGAISEFYSDYDPEYYYRNDSLYNLMLTRRTDDSLKIWFDPWRMTSFRNGYSGEDGLYDQVFRKGWHGGAGSISEDKAEQYGAHPEPGRPYWRKPIPYYTYWGRPAEISDLAPLKNIQTKVAEYSKTTMQSDFQKILANNLTKIKVLRW